MISRTAREEIGEEVPAAPALTKEKALGFQGFLK